MRDITEYIDDYVEDNYGHTNWGYTSTYSHFELNSNKDYDLANNISMRLLEDEPEESRLSEGSRVLMYFEEVGKMRSCSYKLLT